MVLIYFHEGTVVELVAQCKSMSRDKMYTFPQNSSENLSLTLIYGVHHILDALLHVAEIILCHYLMDSKLFIPYEQDIYILFNNSDRLARSNLVTKLIRLI